MTYQLIFLQAPRQHVPSSCTAVGAQISHLRATCENENETTIIAIVDETCTWTKLPSWVPSPCFFNVVRVYPFNNFNDFRWATVIVELVLKRDVYWVLLGIVCRGHWPRTSHFGAGGVPSGRSCGFVRSCCTKPSTQGLCSCCFIECINIAVSSKWPAVPVFPNNRFYKLRHYHQYIERFAIGWWTQQNDVKNHQIRNPEKERGTESKCGLLFALEKPRNM